MGDPVVDPLVYAFIARSVRLRQEPEFGRALDALVAYSVFTTHHAEIVLLLAPLVDALRTCTDSAACRIALVMGNLANNPLSHPFFLGGNGGNDAIAALLQRHLNADALLVLLNLTSGNDAFALDRAITRLHALDVARQLLRDDSSELVQRRAYAVLGNCEAARKL